MTGARRGGSARFVALRGPGRQARWQRARLRRIAAAALVAVAVCAAWGLLRPAPEATVAVTVAARPIAAGAKISPADLRTARWPSSVAVPGVLPLSTAAGRTATAAIAAGEPVTQSRATRSIWGVLRADEQAFTIPLADPALAGLLSPGDLLDLYDPGDHRVVVSAARVVMSTTPKVEPMGGSATADVMVVVAVPRRNSAELAGSLATAATLGTGLVAAARPRG